MTDWLTRLTRRLAGLQPGRYIIIVTVGREVDWTVTEAGKVER